MNINSALRLSRNRSAVRRPNNQWEPSRVELHEDKDTLAWYLRWRRQCWNRLGERISHHLASDHDDWEPDRPKSAVDALGELSRRPG